MTDKQIKEYLKQRGCPEAVWRGGTKYLASSWEKFVAEVENGYCPNCLIQEYWNELDARELIHDIGRDDDVRQADTRFAAMLIGTHIKHWHADRKTDYDFWNYGYPKNASGYFLKDVERYILGKA